jgi:hypothetical protein
MQQAARQQTQLAERRKAAALSRAEFERLTPGFPYPPAPSQKPIAGMLFQNRPGEVPLTLEERMSEEYRWLRDRHGEGAPIRDLVRIFNAQVPHRLTSVIVQPKNGLLSLPKRASGWAFSHKSAIKFSNDVQHDLSSSHDIERKWLLTPQGTYWETHHNMPKGRTEPITDFASAREIHMANLPWHAAMVARDHLISWRGVR